MLKNNQEAALTAVELYSGDDEFIRFLLIAVVVAAPGTFDPINLDKQSFHPDDWQKVEKIQALIDQGWETNPQENPVIIALQEHMRENGDLNRLNKSVISHLGKEPWPAEMQSNN